MPPLDVNYFVVEMVVKKIIIFPPAALFFSDEKENRLTILEQGYTFVKKKEIILIHLKSRYIVAFNVLKYKWKKKNLFCMFVLICYKRMQLS